MSEEASTAGSSANTNSEALSSDSVGEGTYQVSSDDLAELGIKLEPEGKSKDDFPFAKISAEPKAPAKPAKAAVSAKPKLDDAEVKEPDLDDALSEKEDLAWVDKALNPDADEEVASEESSEAEPEIELIRYGKSIKMPMSEAKEFAQKGLDYTEKLRELKAEREEFESQKASTLEEIESSKQEFEVLKKEKEQMDALVEFVRDNHSELYAELEKASGEFRRNYQNPFMSKAIEELKLELRKELGSIKDQNQKAKFKELKQGFYSELSDLKEMHNKKFSHLGIKLDEKAIQEEWIKTGKPLKTIYGELNNEKLATVALSKRQLDIKRRASERAPTMANVKTAKKGPVDLRSKLKGMDYNDIANQIIAGTLR